MSDDFDLPNDADDEFSQPAGGGSYVKLDDIPGELLLISPIEINEEPDRFNEGRTRDVMTADVIVLTGDNQGEYNGMKLSQSTIVKTGKAALRKGQKRVLGRLRRFPTSAYKKSSGTATWQEIEEQLEDPKKARNVKFAWGLDQFSEADATLARQYLKR